MVPYSGPVRVSGPGLLPKNSLSMATIALEGMRFYAYHGFYEEERIIGNLFTVDLYIEAKIQRAAASDDLFATVNYETAYFICQSEMRKPVKLLETLAQNIAERISGQFERVSGVTVRVRKHAPPLGGPVDSSYVEYVAGGMEKGGRTELDPFGFEGFPF